MCNMTLSDKNTFHAYWNLSRIVTLVLGLGTAEGHISAVHLGKKRKKQEIETSSKPVILAFLYVLLSEFAFMLSIRNNIQNNNILT